MYGIENTVYFFLLPKAVGLGMLFGFVYLLFRFAQKKMKKTPFTVMTDILFVLLFAVGAFLFVFDKNMGIIRGYLIFGQSVGTVITVLFCFSVINRKIHKNST